MDVLHDAYFHTEDNYKCMTSGEELSKSRLNALGQERIEKLYSSQHWKCKYKGTKFIEKINLELQPPSNKKLVKFK